MRNGYRRPASFIGPWAAVLLSACASTTTHTPVSAPPPSAPAADSDAAPDPSYDWHVLELQPFGTMLKSFGVKLHEVLLFNDAQAGAGGGGADAPAATHRENLECYSVDAPPRFIARPPETYLLCFEHDRLNRIDAAVRIDAAEAQRTFDRACALWLKTSTPDAGTPEQCKGGEHGVDFNAHLTATADTVLLSMTLSAVAPANGPAP